MADIGLKLMISLLYVIQGMFFFYIFSLPLSYRSVPSYYIIGLFGSASIPFSFKFLFAPLVERYNNQKYGKRKTWIVATILLCSIFMFFMADSSKQQNQYSQKITAFFMFLCILCVAFKDVAADSLAVQTLDSGTISLITFIGDQIGKLITLPLFLNFVTLQWLSLSVDQLRVIYIRGTAVFGIIVVLIIHMNLSESKIIEQNSKIQNISPSNTYEEYDTGHSSFSCIFEHYKNFLNPSFNIFRFTLFLFLINQGMQVVIQSFPVQLIKSGIDKQKLMFGQNISFIPAAFISYLICHYMNPSNCFYYYYLVSILRFVYMVVIHFITIDIQDVAFSVYIIQCLIGSVHYYLENVCMNQKSRGKFQGLSITLLLSISNFGRLTVVQKIIMNEVGYDQCAKGCFVYTALLLCLIYVLRKWLEGGKSLKISSVPEKIQ